MSKLTGFIYLGVLPPLAFMLGYHVGVFYKEFYSANFLWFLPLWIAWGALHGMEVRRILRDDLPT